MKQFFLFISICLVLSVSACAPKQPPVPPVEKPAVKVEEKEPLKKEPVEKKPVEKKDKPVIKKDKPEKKPEASRPEVKTPPADPCIIADGLVLIGELEYVYINDAKMKLRARIDTGATTSSISAKNITKFERDGEKWVRFVIHESDGEQSKILERPVSRTVLIKRHGVESQERLVVALQIFIGPIRIKRDFSLADRSDFKYPVLIGRNVLRGKAAVDVGHKYLTSPMSK